MHHPTDRIAHTTAYVTPVVEHWLEREIAQWVHPKKDRSDDPSHHDRTLLPRSYVSLPCHHDYCQTLKFYISRSSQSSTGIGIGVITPNKIPLTTIVTYLQKRYKSRISNHWATIPACSVVPPIYKQSKKSCCHVSF